MHSSVFLKKNNKQTRNYFFRFVFILHAQNSLKHLLNEYSYNI